MRRFLEMREFFVRLTQDKSGVFAVFTGILIGVFVAVVCAGIEFTAYMESRAALQNAADAMALEWVVTYADNAETTPSTTIVSNYEAAYAAAGNEVWPATLSNIQWNQKRSTPGSPDLGGDVSTGTKNAAGVTIYTPYTATVDVQATYTSTIISSIIGLSKTLHLYVTATASDPVQNVSETGGCNASAGDQDSVYLYIVPRGMSGNYAPPATGSYGYNLAGQLVQKNKGYSNCAATGFEGAAVTSNVGFAFNDITGGASAPTVLCNYNYIQNNSPATGTLSGNNGALDGYGKNMNNDQYGDACQSSNWFFSTLWPPSAGTTKISGYIACVVCSGGGDTGTAALYYWNNGPPTATDTNLQIYQIPSTGTYATTPGAQSGYITEPYSGSTYQYNYNSEFTDKYAVTGNCVLNSDITKSSVQSSSSNHCTPITHSMPQACSLAGSTTVNAASAGSCTTAFTGYSVLTCGSYPNTSYEYFWNDMGGYPEDMDYSDLNYYWTCGATATTAQAEKGYFAYLSQ